MSAATTTRCTDRCGRRLATPRAYQGQHVDVAYGWHANRLYRRTWDRSEGADGVAWAVASAAASRRLGRAGWDGNDLIGPDAYGPIRWSPCEPPECLGGGRPSLSWGNA